MTVEIGSQIPDFSAVSTGGDLRLSALKGSKLVLYFYPKDNTPGCTTQGGDFRDAFEAFREAGALIFGISRDSLRSHQGFKAKHEFPFELISDADEALCTLFGVIKMKNMYGKQVRGIERSTFVLDTNGRLLREWRGVKVPGHVAQVLDYVRSIQ